MFVPSKTDGWQLGVVAEQNNNDVRVQIDKQREETFSLSEIVVASEEIVSTTYDNLTHVSDLKVCVQDICNFFF